MDWVPNHIVIVFEKKPKVALEASEGRKTSRVSDTRAFLETQGGKGERVENPLDVLSRFYRCQNEGVLAAMI